MERRQDVPTAERDIIEQLGRLHQEAQYRLQPSVQSAPENQAHRKSLQHTDQLACSLAHEAAQASSNAPADTMSHLPAIRISDPTPALKQVPFMLHSTDPTGHECQCLALMSEVCGEPWPFM